MFRTTITRSLSAVVATTALVAGGLLTTAVPASAGPLPDIAVTKNLLPLGCEAVVTNIGGSTARDVTVHAILADVPDQRLGDIAPGQTKRAPYSLCSFYMLGLQVIVTTPIDSNPFNNFVRLF